MGVDEAVREKECVDEAVRDKEGIGEAVTEGEGNESRLVAHVETKLKSKFVKFENKKNNKKRVIHTI